MRSLLFILFALSAPLIAKTWTNSELAPCNNTVIESRCVVVGGSTVLPAGWSEGALSAGTPAQLGYQPAGTTNPGDPNLVYDFNAVLEASYQGMFTVGRYTAASTYPGAGDVDSGFTKDSFPGNEGALAFHPNGTSFFMGSDNGSWATNNPDGMKDSVGEFQIPTLINRADLNDRTGIVEATQLQPWFPVYSPDNNLSAGTKGPPQSITGMFYDRTTGQLCGTGTNDYDSNDGGWQQSNMWCIQNPSDLDAANNVNGMYQVRDAVQVEQNLEAAHAASWMADIPAAWQGPLGGRVLWGGGKNSSINSRHTMGPSLFAGNLDSMPTSGLYTITRRMDFWLEQSRELGAHLFTYSNPFWYERQWYNCDPVLGMQCQGVADIDFAQTVTWINDFWTVLSFPSIGFIIPGTRTYVAMGVHAGDNGIAYKGNPTYQAERCGGPCPREEDDYYNKYWLFDLNDIVNAANPWEVFPYEHGKLPFLNQMTNARGLTANMLNGGFDLHTGRLLVLMKERVGSGDQSDILVFQNNAWQEAVQ